MTVSDVIAIIEYIGKSNNPFVLIPGAYLIVTILFWRIHKATRSEYQEDSRERREDSRHIREEFREIREALEKENDRKDKRIEELEQQNVDLLIQIENLKSFIDN